MTTRSKTLNRLVSLNMEYEKIIQDCKDIIERLDNDNSVFAENWEPERKAELQELTLKAVNKEVEFKLALREFAFAENVLPDLSGTGIRIGNPIECHSDYKR